MSPSAGRASAATAGAPRGAATARTRPLAAPRPAVVEVGPDRRPRAVAGRRVEAIREDWVVQDRWWTAAPLHRRYFELVLDDGRNVVVFHDVAPEPRARRWFAQRG